MQHKFLKLAGVKTEKEFYAKFPTEEAFFKAHPEAHPSYAKGGTVPSKDVNTGEFLNTRLGEGNSGQIVPLPDGDPQPKPKRKPIVVTSPNDPRLKAYNDSLSIHNTGLKYLNLFNKENYSSEFPMSTDTEELPFKRLAKYNGTKIVPEQQFSKNLPYSKTDNTSLAIRTNTFKKPVQPVVYQKPQDKPAYKDFLKTVNPDYLGNDYDLETAYNKLPYNVLKAWAANPEKNHLPDTYKLPNHPTFSNESIYYKKGMPAVKWEGNTPVPINQKPQPIQAVNKFTSTPKSFVGKDGTKRNLDVKLQHVEEIPEKIFPAPVAGQSKPARITAPQQSVMPEPQGDYVYGPANSVIGTNVNGKFTPINMPEQRGKVNQADWDMLNNQESMKKYVQGKGLQYKCGGKLKGKKKAAWGAMLGTDQFSGGPDPVNPYPQGFKMPTTIPDVQPMNLNGNAFMGTDGQPVPTSPSVWDKSQPLPTTRPTTQPFQGAISSTGLPTNPAWENFQPLSGQQQAPTDPNRPKTYTNPDYIENKGEGQLNRGQTPNLTPGQQANDKNAVKPYESPKVKMPEGKGAEGSGGQAALMGLMAVSALMPKEKIRRRYVRPEDTQSYNPHPYGTGSQALSEYGNTLKGNKKKAFWGAIVGAVAGKVQGKAAEDKKNAFNNIQESIAPLMMVSDKAQQEATRLDNLYLQGGVQNMQNLQQTQPQFLPNQQPQYMANGGEMYGQGGELITGKGGQTELKSYNPYDGGTFQFNGASHEDGGIDISYKGQPAEVEGQETAFKDEQGDLKIMGNLKNPLTGSKYKDDLKRIADKEKKAQKLIDKGTLLINSANPEDAYEALAFNSGKAMAIGGMISQKRLAESKQHLGNMQEAHLEIAKEKNQHPDDIFAKGGTVGDPDPKKKWVYKDTNTKNLDAKIKVFADMLAAKGIEGYSGAGGGYRGSKTTSGRTSRHARNQALDIIPVAGEAAYQKILNDPELVNYMMTNGLTAINEYDPAIAKKTGATAGHLHIGYDKGTKLADKFRQDAISLYPDKYNSEPKYKMNDANGEMYTAKELAAAYGMTSADIKARVKSGVLSYMGGVTSQNYREPALNKGAGDAQTENYNGFVNKVYKIPPVHFMPKPMDIQTVQGSDTPIDLKQPAPLDKPSNARGISPMQFLGEGYALATNKEEPVKAQLYNPELYSPYQVSFQDRLNENQATFNAVEKQVAYDPTALATLAGQKYSANSAVLADEFRTNQGISNDIINKNVSLLNDAKFKNLGILDQQYVRQSQAKSNTKKINQDALSSISSKLLQKEASNNQLRVLENMYPDYAFNKRTGKAEYYGPDAASQIDWSGVQPLATAQPSKTQVETKVGNTKTTQYYEDPNIATLRALGVQEKQLNQFAPKKKSLSQWMKGG